MRQRAYFDGGVREAKHPQPGDMKKNAEEGILFSVSLHRLAKNPLDRAAPGSTCCQQAEPATHLLPPIDRAGGHLLPPIDRAGGHLLPPNRRRNQPPYIRAAGFHCTKTPDG